MDYYYRRFKFRENWNGLMEKAFFVKIWAAEPRFRVW